MQFNKKKKKFKKTMSLRFEDLSMNTNTAKRFPSRLAGLENAALRNQASNDKTSLESRLSGTHPVGLNMSIVHSIHGNCLQLHACKENAHKDVFHNYMNK